MTRTDRNWNLERERMVRNQIAARGVRDPLVLDAMRRVPRHEFVPYDLLDEAYCDYPLPIGRGQTISQPYIVGLMTELIRPRPGARVLDVGTGCGYQAAVLAEICQHVFSIEIVPELARAAANRLLRLGYSNVDVRCADAWQGLAEHAPYDGIIVAAAPHVVPLALTEQLAVGGRLAVPVGLGAQQLILVEKQADGSLREEFIAAVAFVPMTGGASSASESD